LLRSVGKLDICYVVESSWSSIINLHIYEQEFYFCLLFDNAKHVCKKKIIDEILEIGRTLRFPNISF
jgi:hypothetical protein